MTSAVQTKAPSKAPKKPAQPPAHWRMSGKHPPAVWRMADVDEQQWRDMGCPTMGVALARIKELEAQVRDREAELLATPLPATNSKMLARKAKRKRGA